MQSAFTRSLISHPVGRAVQAAVCKTAEAGAIPARDSILPGIGVERHTPVFQTGVEGALPSCPSISATRNPGVSEASQTSPRRFNSAFVFAWVANFDSEVPALNRRELGATPRQPTISASVVKLLSSFASNEESAGGSPAGCTNLRACG